MERQEGGKAEKRDRQRRRRQWHEKTADDRARLLNDSRDSKTKRRGAIEKLGCKLRARARRQDTANGRVREREVCVFEVQNAIEISCVISYLIFHFFLANILGLFLDYGLGFFPLLLVIYYVYIVDFSRVKKEGLIIIFYYLFH